MVARAATLAASVVALWMWTAGAVHLGLAFGGAGYLIGLLASVLYPLCVLVVRTTRGLAVISLMHSLTLAATLAADLLAFIVLFESTAVLLYLLIGRGVYGSWSAAYHIVIYTMAASLVLTASLMSAAAEIGVVMLFAVKVPLLALHLWLPSAHASAPLAGSVMLSGVILKLGGLLGLRFLANGRAAPILAGVGLITGIFASVTSLRVSGVKAIVAYSSVIHMSSAAVGIALGGENAGGATVALMMAHGLVSPALFVLATRRPNGPFYRALVLLFVLANAGFPPTPNFWGEIALISSAMSVSELAALALLAVTTVATGANLLVAGGGSSAAASLRWNAGNAPDVTRREFCMLSPLAALVILLGRPS